MSSGHDATESLFAGVRDVLARAADQVAFPVRPRLAHLYRVIRAVPTSRAASRALRDINQMVSGPHAMGRPAVLAASLGPRLRWAGADPGLPSAVVSPDHA